MASGYPVCYYCKQMITVPYLIAFNLAWHKEHLACKVCRRDFSGAGMVVREGPDGFAYCDPCALKEFADVCADCGEKILEGDVLSAGGQKWHPEHFCCNQCRTPFSSTFFPGPDGKFYCERHYYEKANLICATCEQPLLGGSTVVMGSKNFHVKCFVCSYCKNSLSGGEYWPKDNKPYCSKCYLILFG